MDFEEANRLNEILYSIVDQEEHHCSTDVRALATHPDLVDVYPRSEIYRHVQLLVEQGRFEIVAR